MNEATMRDAGKAPPIEVFCDFVNQSDVVDLGAFDFTAINSGTNAGTIAIGTAASGSRVRITGIASTDASGGQIQSQAAHIVTDYKPISFKADVQLGETTSSNGATESQLYLGLFPVDTSLDASVPIDGMYFVKADGGTVIKCEVRVASATPVFTSTISAGVYTEAKADTRYGISVFPKGADSQVAFIINGALVALATNISLPANTVILAPSLSYRSGDATGTKWCECDWIGSFQDR